MLSTPGPRYPCHHSCLSPCLPARQCRGSLPTHWLLRRCPGSSTGRPRCPRSDSVAGKGQASRRAACGLSPALDQLGLPLSFRAAPGASYSPSAPQTAPLILLHARLLPPEKTKPAELGSVGARWRVLAQKPQQRPPGITQPCQAQSILPLNMKLPLSPNPLPRGWVSPHFSSLMLAQHGGLQGSAFTSLFLPCVLFSPPLFPLLLQWLFQRSGDAGAAPAAIVM